MLDLAIQYNEFLIFQCRRVVVVAVQDSAAGTIGNALSELKKIGARDPIISELRSSFALIGYKGVETPKWITQVCMLTYS